MSAAGRVSPGARRPRQRAEAGPGRNRGSQRGSSAVEFALTIPLVLFLVLGTADFGRVFYHAMTAVHAADAGAFYGAHSLLTAADTSKIQAVTTEDANDILRHLAPSDLEAGEDSLFTSTPELFCDCPGAPGIAVDCYAGTCAAPYLSPRVYLKSRVEAPFTTIVQYPSIPDSVELDLTVWVRVQ